MRTVGTSVCLFQFILWERMVKDVLEWFGMKFTVFAGIGMIDAFLRFISLDASLSVKGTGIFKGKTKSDRDAVR